MTTLEAMAFLTAPEPEPAQEPLSFGCPRCRADFLTRVAVRRHLAAAHGVGQLADVIATAQEGAVYRRCPNCPKGSGKLCDIGKPMCEGCANEQERLKRKAKVTRSFTIQQYPAPKAGEARTCRVTAYANAHAKGQPQRQLSCNLPALHDGAHDWKPTRTLEDWIPEPPRAPNVTVVPPYAKKMADDFLRTMTTPFFGIDRDSPRDSVLTKPFRRFVFRAGIHDKFWQIRTVGSSVHTSWGRIGTDGRSLSKFHGTPRQAELAAAKQIRSKVAKGYRECIEAKPQPETPEGRLQRQVVASANETAARIPGARVYLMPCKPTDTEMLEWLSERGQIIACSMWEGPDGLLRGAGVVMPRDDWEDARNGFTLANSK